MFSGKSACIIANMMFSAKVLVLLQSGCIRAKVVVFEKKWLYSNKSGGIHGKWLYSGKAVVFLQSGCIRDKVVVFG